MTLSKLALKNIKKSIKDYSVYFMTLVIGVVIFYIFNALESQTIALNVSSAAYDIIELMNLAISGMSVFVAIVLGCLIIYASRFLIKRRSKEFGVYLTLGMSKSKMSGILFFETLIIGVISLAVGLIIGVILSQFMSIVVANAFETDMSQFKFIFAPKAAIKTCIYFGIMYFIVMVFNTVSIGKCKLLDLLYGAKKNEKLKFRNPILCLAIFVISALVLAYAYKRVTVDFSELGQKSEFIKIIIMGAVSTFFVFWSLSGMMMAVFTKMKGLYFKGLNSFTLKQFSSKANTMVVSMTIICLMLFLTIVMLGSAISLTKNMNDNIKGMLTTDAFLVKDMDLTNEEVEEVRASLVGTAYEMDESSVGQIVEDSKKTIWETLVDNGFDVNSFTDIVVLYDYAEDSLTIGSYCGDELEEVLRNYTFVHPDSSETILRLTDYNKVAELYGNEKIELGEDEYAIVADFDAMVQARNKILATGRTVQINGHELKPGYDECVDGAVAMQTTHTNEGIFVVNDDIVDESMIDENMLLANYAADTKEGKNEIEESLSGVIDSIYLKNSMISMNTKITVRASSMGLSVMASFISLYLGIIFLIASAAVLSLKELSESADNVEKFAILRRIGVDEKMINTALFKQIGMFFLFPMIIACVHSIFGLQAANHIFEVFGTKGLGGSIFITALIIVGIYGGYFILTYLTSKRIIRNQ